MKQESHDQSRNRCPANRTAKRRRDRGPGAWQALCSNRAFTLPELMVTLVVSGLLVSGIVSSYLVQKRTYEDEALVMDMQMNGRLAVQRIATIIRAAGLGCKDNFPPKDNQVFDGVFQSYTHVFTVTDRNDGPDVLTVISGLRPRTYVESVASDRVVLADVLNLNGQPIFDVDKNRYIFFSPRVDNRYLKVLSLDPMTREVQLSAPCATANSNDCSIRAGDDVFRVNAYTITLDQNGAELLDVDGDGSVVDRDGDHVPDLYIYNNTKDLIPDTEVAAPGEANVSSAEVADGIEVIQFRFGWDANEDGRIEEAEFVDDPTGNEDQVRAVQIDVLARSAIQDPDFTDPNTEYTLGNYTLILSPDDRHYHRQRFSETVMVRNMNL